MWSWRSTPSSPTTPGRPTFREHIPTFVGFRALRPALSSPHAVANVGLMACLPDPMTEAEYPVFRLVNMAFLATVGGSAVNGVAAIHSEIIKEDIFQVSPQLLFSTVGCPAQQQKSATGRLWSWSARLRTRR